MERYQTHGFKSKASDGDAEREIAIKLFDDGCYSITIMSKWNGNDNPVITNISLSKSAFALLSEVIIEASLNMNRWATPIQSDKGRD